MLSARQLGLEVYKSSANEDIVRCPWHDDRTPSATYNKSKGLFYCFTCGTGYNTEQLAEKLDIDLDDNEDALGLLEDYDLLVHHSSLEIGYPIRKEVPEYVAKRGISLETCIAYDLHYKEGAIPSVVMPVRNLRGELVGATYRFIDKVGYRYIKMCQTTPIWPMPFLHKYKEGESIIVTEGAWSAMKIHSFFGEIYPVALLGAKANHQILDILAPFRPIFLYDNDTAGIRACRKMRKLSPLVKAYTLTTSPDDMDKEQLWDLIYRTTEAMVR